MNPHLYLPRPKLDVGAFSLIELLAVIGVLSVLAAIGSASLQGVAHGSGVRGAVSLAGSVVEQARTEALRRGGGARILIDADPASKGWLRRMAVATGIREGNGTITWKLDSQAVYLPENTYFNISDSKGYETMAFDFRTGASTGSDAYFFEYDRFGRLRSPSAGGPSRLEFFSGISAPESGEIQPRGGLGQAGLILRPAGNVTYFETIQTN